MSVERSKRRENFSEEEKQRILEFVQENVNILEDKHSHPRSQDEKKRKWKELAEKMRATGPIRDWKDLRGTYQRWKGVAKKNISAYKRQLKSTGGGPSTTKPSETDFLLSEICPADFVVDENPFDSDGVRDKDQDRDVAVVVPEDNDEGGISKYILDPATGELLLESKEPQQKVSNTRPIEPSESAVISEPPLKKRKKEMTAYEESLLRLQEKKLQDAIEFQREEHEAKMKLIAAESKFKQEHYALSLEAVKKSNEESSLRIELLRLQLQKLQNSS